jgi:hypothetical protein
VIFVMVREFVLKRYLCGKGDVSCDLFFDGVVRGVCWFCYNNAKVECDRKRRLLKENNVVGVV